MKACIFAGPTLPPQDEARAQAAVWLPPAKHGDVYRTVTLLRPSAIGIVDGYFQWVPSVWHKEILWAMQQGVHVFGAASMGALRAAELAPFGMRGVGRIFEAYRHGVLSPYADEPFEDDDEVAVVHGPAESGYLAVSEAMVNIRCTLAKAERAGVITRETRSRIATIAKGLYFPERNYESALESARAQGVDAAQLGALEAWFPAGRVNQKREDALVMLETMRDFLARDPAPAVARFSFEHTTLWERVAAAARETTLHDAEENGVLEELRLDGGRWHELRHEVRRTLMAHGATEAAVAPATEALARRLAECRAQPQEVERVLAEAQRMDAARRVGEEMPLAVIERRMLALLKDAGEYQPLRARADDKLSRISARRDLPDIGEFSHLKLLELRDWYFSRLLGEEMPDDIEQCVRELGYADLTHFHRALFSEFVYREDAGLPAAPLGAATRLAGD